MSKRVRTGRVWKIKGETGMCLLNSQPIDLKSCYHLYTFIVQKIVRDTRHRVNVLVIYYRKFLLYELFACLLCYLFGDVFGFLPFLGGFGFSSNVMKLVEKDS